MTISVVRESAVIHAPMARLFALSTSIDLVRKTLGMTPMETGVERGLTSGHVVGESRVVWRGLRSITRRSPGSRLRNNTWGAWGSMT
jgi:hypothetical protein